MIFLEINNPNPVPVCDFVANFVKSLGCIWGFMPMPLSFMLTITCCLSFFSALTNIVPSLVNLTALLIKLEITWFSLPLSASTKISSLGSYNNLISLFPSFSA